MLVILDDKNFSSVPKWPNIQKKIVKTIDATAEVEKSEKKSATVDIKIIFNIIPKMETK